MSVAAIHLFMDVAFCWWRVVCEYLSDDISTRFHLKETCALFIVTSYKVIQINWWGSSVTASPHCSDKGLICISSISKLLKHISFGTLSLHTFGLISYYWHLNSGIKVVLYVLQCSIVLYSILCRASLARHSIYTTDWSDGFLQVAMFKVTAPQEQTHTIFSMSAG